MTREPHPDWKEGGLAERMAAWRKQPGESEYDFIQRRSADFAAWQAEQDAAAEYYRAEHGGHEPSRSLGACGVGNYDGNGNPKGSGWW